MSITLDAKIRTEKGRKTNALRIAGSVPAIVYGADTQPKSIFVNRNQFLKTYEAAGESSLVELKVDEGAPMHVLIHDYQTDPLRDEVTHVDFLSVDMNKEIEADVELYFQGESPAVKATGGTLVRSVERVSVRCLPSKLVRSIPVDISKLVTFDDVIRVSDLAVPEGVTILNKINLTVAVVEPPRSDEELKALDEAVEENIESVGVVKEKKVEETEGESADATVEGGEQGGAQKKSDKQEKPEKK